MYKVCYIFLGFFLWAVTLHAQKENENTIEQQVADTACVCLSRIDTNTIKTALTGLKMQCLSKAIVKNQEAINKNFETEKRREEDLDKLGIRGSILIKVQNILTNSCPNYAFFEEKTQVQRQTRH